jgi:hypothetical protein
LGNNRYPNLSWSPKPPFSEDFDGSVTAESVGGTYAIKSTTSRIPGTTEPQMWRKEVFIATFEPEEGDVLLLTLVPTTRIEAQRLVKVHQRRAIDEREKADEPPPSAPAGGSELSE